MNELIEKLKKNEKPFGLLSPEEQACFEGVGTRNCLWYHGTGWKLDSGADMKFAKHCTYAIKPDYNPEPQLTKELHEELRSIIIASNLDNGKEPVWDGTVIGKPNQHTLKKMGLAECCHSYYFPTPEGKEAYKNYQPEVPGPESVNLEIKESIGGVWLGVYPDERVGVPRGFTPLHCLPSLPGFALFWYEDTNQIVIDFSEVSLYRNEGKTVFARFRK